MDWGDGSTPQTKTNDSMLSHTYAHSGRYEIKIKGDFPGWDIDTTSVGMGAELRELAKKMVEINHWGNLKFKNMSRMFNTAMNVVGKYTDSPDTSEVTDISFMFADADNFNSPVNFNTSKVTSMAHMFSGTKKFNQSLNSFDISKVTDMRSMFSGAKVFNIPINYFNTSNVTNMAYMFSNTNDFNQPISNFQTLKVKDFTNLFAEASKFNQDVSMLDFSNIEYNGTTPLHSFVKDTALTTKNFDKLISRWNDQLPDMTSIPRPVFAYSDGLTYCKAEWALENLKLRNWVVTNAEKNCGEYSKPLKISA